MKGPLLCHGHHHIVTLFRFLSDPTISAQQREKFLCPDNRQLFNVKTDQEVSTHHHQNHLLSRQDFWEMLFNILTALHFSLASIAIILDRLYNIHTQVAILMAELLSQVGPPVQVTKSRGYNVWLWILPGFHIFCEPKITRILFSSRACKDVQLCI